MTLAVWYTNSIDIAWEDFSRADVIWTPEQKKKRGGFLPPDQLKRLKRDLDRRLEEERLNEEEQERLKTEFERGISSTIELAFDSVAGLREDVQGREEVKPYLVEAERHTVQEKEVLRDTVQVIDYGRLFEDFNRVMALYELVAKRFNFYKRLALILLIEA